MSEISVLRSAGLGALLLFLSSCSDGPDETGPGGLPKEDAAALDEAAEKLDTENTPVPVTIPQAGSENGEERSSESAQ